MLDIKFRSKINFRNIFIQQKYNKLTKNYDKITSTAFADHPTDVMHFYIIIKNSWNVGTRSGAPRIPSNKKRELNSRETLFGGMFKIIGKLLVF